MPTPSRQYPPNSAIDLHLPSSSPLKHQRKAEVVAGSAAWLGRGLSCVCVQGREGDSHPSFDLTPAQEHCLQRLQNRLDIAYDSSIPGHQVYYMSC
ncbi:hypothetical protein R6Q57_001966 [Mikania cordata]